MQVLKVHHWINSKGDGVRLRVVAHERVHLWKVWIKERWERLLEFAGWLIERVEPDRWSRLAELGCSLMRALLRVEYIFLFVEVFSYYLLEIKNYVLDLPFLLN